MAKSTPPIPDLPIPFGYKIAWYAVRSMETDMVVSTLGLRNSRVSTWASGINAAYERGIFVTPPILGWTLAVGSSFADQLGDRPDKVVAPELCRSSKQFGEAQFFFSYRVVEAHLWAQGKSGQLVRGYYFVGDRGETGWNVGNLTEAELAVGFQNLEGFWPNEQTVMEIAKHWSVNPCEIGQLLNEPCLGTLCDPPLNH